MSWVDYALKRLGLGVLVLLGVAVIVFSMVRLVPGDPAVVILGRQTNPEVLERLRRDLGLHLPVWEQFVVWIADLLQGDWGRSVHSGTPVMELIAQRYPRTLELTLVAILISILISFPAGIASGSNRNTPIDYAAMFFSQLGVSIPSFWMGLMFILLFAKYLNLLPPSGYVPFSEDPIGNLERILMPALTLGIINAAVITRFLRASLLEQLSKDYIRTARAFGHPRRRVILKYTLRNSLIPTLTIIGLQFGWLLGGVVVVEEVFAFPGVGRLIVSGIFDRDYPVVQGSLLIFAATFVFINLVVDLLYAWLDPRIKY